VPTDGLPARTAVLFKIDISGVDNTWDNTPRPADFADRFLMSLLARPTIYSIQAWIYPGLYGEKQP